MAALWLAVLLVAGGPVAVASMSASPQPADAPADGLEQAAAALDAGKAGETIRLATAYLERHPGDTQASLLLTRAYLQQDDWSAAYRVISEAARAHPDDVDVHFHLGLVTRLLAAAEFERLVTASPDSARARQLQAEVFEAQDRRDDAERAYAAALSADPALVDALLGLAKLQRIRLACAEAIEHYQRAERVRPTFDAAYGLGVCHAQLQQDELAVKDFELAVQRSPGAGVAWAWLGTSLVKLGQVPRGIEALEHAVALQPEMSDAHYVLGMAYRTAGDQARARAAFEKVEQLRARPPQ